MTRTTSWPFGVYATTRGPVKQAIIDAIDDCEDIEGHPFQDLLIKIHDNQVSDIAVTIKHRPKTRPRPARSIAREVSDLRKENLSQSKPPTARAEGETEPMKELPLDLNNEVLSITYDHGMPGPIKDYSVTVGLTKQHPCCNPLSVALIETGDRVTLDGIEVVVQDRTEIRRNQDMEQAVLIGYQFTLLTTGATRPGAWDRLIERIKQFNRAREANNLPAGMHTDH